ncbi:PHD-zinc-finger like domain-containing protein [Phycomyces nitens]|nr:PHD-zinc-finger like domain-containing protein [Phycomyces nitens]
MPTEDIGKSYPDACAVCEGDRSTKKNPILYCDGKGCNLPVHKLCYNVDKVPLGEWLCQQCETTKKKRPTHVVCCPVQTGALRHTILSGEFMHVLCAMWNKSVDHKSEPYIINKTSIGADECYICSKKQGICVKCESASCSRRFHVTCAMNQGLIKAAPNVPDTFVPHCTHHRSESAVKLRHYAPVKRGKLLKRRVVDVTSDEDDDEDEEKEDEKEKDEEDAEMEDGGDSGAESEEVVVPKTRRASPNKRNNKRPATTRNKNGSKIFSFLSEHSNSEDDMGTRNKKFPRIHSSDSEDDMGTKKPSEQRHASDSDDDMGTQKPSRPLVHHPRQPHARENGSSSGSSNDALGTNQYGLTLRERLDAKRKKTVSETAATTPSNNPTKLIGGNTSTNINGTTNSNNGSSTSGLTIERPKSAGSNPVAPSQPPKLKQKLPNKAHLAIPGKSPIVPTMPLQPMANNQNANNAIGVNKRMSLSSGPSTPFMKDMEEIRAASGPKWSTSGPMTPLTHSIHQQQLPAQIASTTSSASALVPTPAIPVAANIPSSFDLIQQQHPQRPPLATPRPIEDKSVQLTRKPDGPFVLTDSQQNQLFTTMTTMVQDAIAAASANAGSVATLSTGSALQQEQQRYIQENIRLRAEADRFQTFKKNVSDVFCGLQFSVPGLEANPDTMEAFVIGLKEMLARSGPLSEQDVEKITKSVDSSKA